MHFFRLFISSLKKNKTSGSFLADVLIATGVLTLSISGAISILNQSVQTNSVNKNKIIAVNLAREGLEGMRLLRESNWIRYANDKRTCWNFWNNTDENNAWDDGDEKCTEHIDSAYEGQNNHPLGVSNETGTEVLIKSYLLLLNTVNYDFTLAENLFYIPEKSDGGGDVTNQIETFEQSYTNDEGATISLEMTINRDGSTPSSVIWEARKNGLQLTSQLYLDSTTGLYTHFPTGNTPTDFYREIFIEYPFGENGFYPREINTATNRTLDNQIIITSKVWYMGHGGIMRDVTLETELTDHLERTNWSE